MNSSPSDTKTRTSNASRVSRRQLLKMGTVAGAALLPATFGATASAAPGPSGAKSFTQAAQDKVTIKFLSRGGEYIKGVVDEQIAAFNEHRPEIEIQHEAAAGDHVQKIQLDAAAGNVADAWFDANRATGLWWHSDLLESVDPYLEAEPTFNEEDYIDSAWIAQTYEGQRWGLPWDSGGMALIYNIDLLNEAGIPLPDTKTPMSWDDLLEMARQLTVDFNGKHPGEDGFDSTRVRRYGYVPDYSNGLPQWLQSNGAEIIQPDPEGKEALICPIDSPEAIEAFQWIADLSSKHFVAPDPAAEQQQEISLQSSTTAMQHNGVWMLGRLNEAQINWGVAPLPVKKTPVSYGHYSPLVMTNRSEHKQETFDWIYWSSCSPEGEQILVDKGMQQPIRKDLGEEFVASQNPPATEYRQVFYDVFNPETFRWPGDSIGTYWNGWCQRKNDLWGAELEQLWAGRVQYEEIASDFRAETERVLRTGEVS